MEYSVFTYAYADTFNITMLTKVFTCAECSSSSGSWNDLICIPRNESITRFVNSVPVLLLAVFLKKN